MRNKNLSDKRLEFLMSKVGWQYFMSECINISNLKLSPIANPFNSFGLFLNEQ